MAARKNVSAAVVREFAATVEGANAIVQAGAKLPGSRGRLDPSTVAVFHKENPRMRYETASVAEKRTVEVPVVGLDKAGRKTTRKRILTTEDARAALGHPAGRRGRFDKELLSMALEALDITPKVAKTFK